MHGFFLQYLQHCDSHFCALPRLFLIFSTAESPSKLERTHQASTRTRLLYETNETRLTIVSKNVFIASQPPAGYPCTALEGNLRDLLNGTRFHTASYLHSLRQQAPRRNTAGVPEQTRGSGIRGVHFYAKCIIRRKALDGAESCP